MRPWRGAVRDRVAACPFHRTGVRTDLGRTIASHDAAAEFTGRRSAAKPTLARGIPDEIAVPREPMDASGNMPTETKRTGARRGV